MTKEQAVAMLRGAVMAEVESRHRIFQTSDELEYQLGIMAEWLTSPNGKFCIVLFGNCGNGKTTLVKAFQKLLNLLDLKDEYKETYGMQISDAKDIVWLCREDRSAWQRLCRKKMLAIDDLGTEITEGQDYGNKIFPVIDMLYKRYDLQLFTIITSNLMPNEIADKYGPRIADRLNEMAYRIVFNNESYRKETNQ